MDPQVIARMHGVGDERVAVVVVLARFDASLLKSDALRDDDSSTGA